MKKMCFALLAMLIFAALPGLAQIVTSSPSPLYESSNNVILTFDAASAQSNKGLINLPQGTDVYAHIGVITNKSNGDSDWKHTVCDWPSSADDKKANTDKNRLTKIADNTYTLNIGQIRSYFNITDPSEHVQKIAMVFRTADGKKECKTSAGKDIYLVLDEDNFSLALSADKTDELFTEPRTVVYTLTATEAADLSITVNGTELASKSAATSLSASYEFKEFGVYTIAGKAMRNGIPYAEQITVTFADPAMMQPYPGGVPKMGAVKNDDGSVTFCLAAPDKLEVTLVGEWDNYQILDKNKMKIHDYEGNRYFWTTVTGLENDKWYPYYFFVDKTYKVADPYAHLVLDCYSDRQERNSVWPDRPKHPYGDLKDVMLAVYRGDIDDYEFSEFEIPDHENLVIYELLVRDFTGATDGAARGFGTIKRAQEKIPYIKSLGFNAIELLPIMEYNGVYSWGYNTNFYMAPDKNYGSPTDYKDFIEACHKEGIAVILDIVFNQSDGLHPWYQMYPIDSNPFYNKTAPHDYNVLNDWRQDNPLVQQQWDDALRYWLTAYNVDGFRFDLVKGLGDNDSYASGTEAYNQSRVDRMTRLHSVIKSVKPNGIHINENLAGAAEEKAMGNDGQLQWANVNNASCQFAMGYDSGDCNLNRFLASRDSGRPWASTVSYAESHDEERMAFKCIKYGTSAVKTDMAARCNRLGTLAVQMLLTPGPKMVWMFGELANDQTTKDANGGNDTGNKIVDWTWLNDPDRAYLHDTYAAVINLRMDNPELFSSEATFTATNLSGKNSQPRSMKLVNGDKEIIAFINPAVSGDPVSVNVTSENLTAANHKLIRASAGFTPTLEGSGNELSVAVPAGSFAIFTTANTSTSGIDDTLVGDSDTATAIGGIGEIIINGTYSNLSVYDIAGRAINTLEVPAGIYLVNIDGKATKVRVR